MDWLSKLEKKYGRYAIDNLTYYVIALYATGFVLNFINPSFYPKYLSLDAGAVLHGQIWRVITFIIQPPSNSLFFIVFALMLYYFIGRSLENVWGAFRFNVYFFSGVLFHVIAAILIYLIFGISLQMGTTYLNLSLFLVFAALFPDMEFCVYFVLPIKVKWLALVDALFFAYTILQAFLPGYGGGPYGAYYKANALAAVVSIMNFLIFFYSTKKVPIKQRQRKKKFEQSVAKSRPANVYANGAKHRCAVCGRTELDDDTLEFRYCSKCNGNYEYCQEHLFTHQHVK